MALDIFEQNDREATPHVAVVTGATRGVGRELALGLAHVGMVVAVLGRDAGAGEAVAALIRSKGGHACAVAADVRNEASMADAARVVLGAFGQIDALVCAAGMTLPVGSLVTQDIAGFHDCFDTNVLGVITALKAFVPAMAARNAGRIVAIGGTFGHKGVADQAIYAASKWALRGLMKSTALEVARYGITANVIAPGGIEGEKIRGLFAQRAEQQGKTAEEVYRSFVKGSALGRLVDGADVLAALLHLLGPAGRNITGQDIIIDAGTII